MVLAAAGWRGGIEGFALPGALGGMEGPAVPDGRPAGLLLPLGGLAAGVVLLVAVLEEVACPLPEGAAVSAWPLLATGAVGSGGEGAPLPGGATDSGSAFGCSVAVDVDVLPTGRCGQLGWSKQS